MEAIFQKANNVHGLSQENGAAIAPNLDEISLILDDVKTITEVTGNVAKHNSSIENHGQSISDGGKATQEASTDFTQNFQSISSRIGQITTILQSTRSVSGRSALASADLANVTKEFKV